MKIIWLGHAGFRIEIEDQILLIDPWLTGNPMFPEGREAEATDGATHILVTHGHFDHTGDVVGLAKAAGIPVAGMFDLISWWAEAEGIEGLPFHKGGTITLGGSELVIDSDVAPAHPGDSIMAGEKVIGTVTSAAFGHRTGENLAMGFVDPERAETGTELEVLVLGERLPARVVEECRYDPGYEKVRA